MQHLSLKRASLFAATLTALALLLPACQPAQQQSNANANANASNTSTANAPSGYIDLVGKWEGQAGGKPCTLTITTHMGETFSGTMTSGENVINVAGIVDLKTREIIIRETDVKKGPGGYSLGVGRGVIAANGRQMSGEWKAKGTSTFSFTK
ncbi:MAG TPA: hypothetical protein VJS44_13830 [Pyrinomonadaceae bacterium]|nr:hypothetical protein [Pyrinomonadaceae bacterium]